MGKILLITSLIFLICAAIWFLFFKESPAQKVTKEGPIIFLGNSITAGVGADEGKDFPSLITQELGLKNVINAGVSGDTTADTLKRLKVDVLDKNPSLVVIELGGNDFLRQTISSEALDNLESIVKQIHGSGAAIILVHIKFPRDSEEYKKGYEQIAEKYHTEVVWDTLAGILNNSSRMADTIHPNTSGHKIMAERITPYIKKIIN